ncbi:MAG: response regulator transcription factor [Altererythrobacter sp.]
MSTHLPPATVILADDHPAFLDGLRQYLDTLEGYALVAVAQDGAECLELLRMHRPDWAIIDLAMPSCSGFDVLRAALEEGIETRILVMSMYADDAYARKACDAGASGFVAKEDAIAELARALAAGRDTFYTSPSVGRPTIAPIDSDARDGLDLLTPAERRILLMLGQGSTSREIAEAMGISPRTVQKHRQNMADKLDLHGPNRLLEFAVRHVQLLDGN